MNPDRQRMNILNKTDPVDNLFCIIDKLIWIIMCIISLDMPQLKDAPLCLIDISIGSNSFNIRNYPNYPQQYDSICSLHRGQHSTYHKHFTPQSK